MTDPATIKALAERLRGIAVCEPSPEPSGTMREAATALDTAAAEIERLRGGVDVHEVGRDDLKRRARQLLDRNGWKPGDRFSAHSTTELMVALAIDAVKTPPDRCAWPECGCCHDASCNEARIRSAIQGGENAE